MTKIQMIKQIYGRLGFCILFIILTLITACLGNQNKDELKRPQVGGACSYKEIPGTARITKIEPANEEGLFQSPVKVYFDFTPSDPKATETYRFNNWEDKSVILTIFGGKLPPAESVRQQGLTPGSTHPCVRYEIDKGTCTPVIFLLQDFNEKDCLSYKR